MIFRYTYAQKLPGTDPGFLERGFVGTCIKVWGFALLFLSRFPQIPHENEKIWP